MAISTSSSASPESLEKSAETGATTARIAAAQPILARNRGRTPYPIASSTSSGTNTTAACTSNGCRGRPMNSVNTKTSNGG